VQALRGMKEVIRRSPNLIIMTEWLYKLNKRSEIKSKTTELLNFMVGQGYGIY
jgi:hypothetical protein